MTPTARTLAYLRKLGLMAEVVEKWIPRANIRKDLFGIVDIVAFVPGSPKTLFLQVTTSANIAARKKKAAEVHAEKISSGGREVWVLGWKKVKNRWQPEGDRLCVVGGGVVAWKGRYDDTGEEYMYGLREALVGYSSSGRPDRLGYRDDGR